MTKRMVCTIGYQDWACDPHDAILLLDVASRMTAVRHHTGRYSGPMIPQPDAEPLVTAFSLHEIEEPEPPEPEIPVEPPAPLMIAVQRKITYKPSDDIPF